MENLSEISGYAASRVLFTFVAKDMCLLRTIAVLPLNIVPLPEAVSTTMPGLTLNNSAGPVLATFNNMLHMFCEVPRSGASHQAGIDYGGDFRPIRAIGSKRDP